VKRIDHYIILAGLIGSIFLFDLWTPLGIAVWLLYVIPMGYAVRYLQHERSTYGTVSMVAGGLTVLILIGWFFSPTRAKGITQDQALFNRGLGIVAIWVMAMVLAWLSNRMRSLKEMEAVMQRRLNEKELRIKQALDAGGIAAVEWDLRKGSVRWAGHHDSLTGHGMGPFEESFGEFQQRVYAEDRDTMREEIDRAMREGSDFNLQYRVYAPENQLPVVTVHGRFIYRGAQPVRMVGVCSAIADRDPSTMDQSAQLVIDMEELAKTTGWREPSWKKSREWAQRAARVGMDRIRILPKKPKNIA
jgi:hypothetical protein